ncbi:MAG TPA: amidase family protein [Acidimicrobiales bacterium]|nr:amidase family protein [Acidimicrobiales bacterium]
MAPHEAPWQGDACSLIDAFRSGERSPAGQLEATVAAIEASALNAFCHVDAEAARSTAARADPAAPLGGVPVAVKELDPVAGWPLTEASLAFADRVSSYDSTAVGRLRASGGVLVGQTTASEFGGLNVSVSLLHGVTGNPWNATRTTGGSSAGSAAAVAGGLVPLATGGDGGGSIRIPAGFCGLVGMKGTAGRIPRGPRTAIAPLTVVFGCLARSVRDVARYYDVANGYDSRYPYSLPRVDGWERDLGSRDLRGMKVAISPTLGTAVVLPEVEAVVLEAGEALARSAGLEVVDVPVKLPGLGLEWAMSNMASLLVELGDRYPDCLPQLTQEMAFGLKLASEVYNLDMAARCERNRTEANELMADLFDQVDFVICATNPDVAFPAEVRINTRVGDRTVGPENNGALTIPANVSGNPAISVPAGIVDGLPVGMQVMARHHADALLLDLALAMERERPWPLVAPGAPC